MTPNLFLLGAARCGSTSLHAILGQHPDIHAARRKEPTFFNWPFQMVRNPLEYFSLFDSPRRYRMDGSVTYLPNPQTGPVLRALFPEARFVVIIREPKARAHALYRHLRYFGFEHIETFAEALQAEAGRYTSRDFMVTCPWEFWLFQYCRSTQYDEQLARYFTLFSREQFHVLTLAELSKEPLETAKRIMRFLDLDPQPAEHFKFEILNRQETYPPCDVESDAILSRAFAGLTERTDRLVGRALDWSM